MRVIHFFGQVAVVFLCILALQKNYPSSHYTQRWISDFFVPTLVVLLIVNAIYFFEKRLDYTRKPILKICVRILFFIFYIVIIGWMSLVLAWFGPM